MELTLISFWTQRSHKMNGRKAVKIARPRIISQAEKIDKSQAVGTNSTEAS